MKNSDREFFRKIYIAAFANPFGVERENVDLEISGLEKSSSNDLILLKLLEDVAARVKRYKGNIKELSSEDRTLFRYGVLFWVFHHFCDEYDSLIADQVKAGSDSLEVKFAKDLLRHLHQYDFTKKDALRYLAFFFQMRRGYYFISNIIGKSKSVKKLRQALWNNIFTCDMSLYEGYMWNRMEDFSTIILGETGTGKGMAAGAIGRSGHIPFNEKSGRFSESFTRSFISINLSQFSEHLIESELFGHTKGAFTGAVANHEGVFFRCSPHGAIFLDEIGEVSTTLQIKLLQVIQERAFSPVGSHSTEKFQGRVIAATNQPMHKLRRDGRFRDDFYYRLCSDIIELPSLRKRLDENPSELDEILAATLQRILGKKPRALVREVSQRIQGAIPCNYQWPGNIRELEQCVRQILLNRSYSWQQGADVVERLNDFQEQFNKGKFSSGQLVAAYCSHLYKQHGSYEKVARIAQLDRRTVKKYIIKDA